MQLLCVETSDLTRTSGISLILNSTFKPCTQLRMPKNELVQGSYSEPRVSQKSTLNVRLADQRQMTINNCLTGVLVEYEGQTIKIDVWIQEDSPTEDL